MTVQIGQSSYQLTLTMGRIGAHTHATVHLQSKRGTYQNGQPGLKSGLTTLDVQKFLSAQVGTETGLRHHVIAQTQGHLRGQNAVTSMRNVGKGATMNKGRRALYGLHKVGLEGLKIGRASCRERV